MTEKITAVKLTDPELIMLDGQCSPDVQAAVDAAKARAESIAARSHLPEHIARLVADVVGEAVTHGLVVYGRTDLRSCGYCGAKPDPLYVLYKSGPRRGRPNYDKPRHLTGIEYARRFVRMEGHPTLGACADCAKAARDELVAALADVRAQVDNRLAVDGRPAWVRYDRRRCKRCDWVGHEGEMIHGRTLLGDGWYPAACPDCGAGSGFSSLVEVTDGHVVDDRPVKKFGFGEPHFFPRAAEFRKEPGR